MAVGLKPPAELLAVPGIRLGVASAGIRRGDRADLCLIELRAGSHVAAMFTRNRFRAAPVLVAEQHLRAVRPQALVINSGNANAGTGAVGEADAREVCNAVAQTLQLDTQAVLPFSTGVIGQRLPVAKIRAALGACAADLSEDGWLRAANAIMTTDIVAKGVSRSIRVGDAGLTITGIAKGAGMIRPDMATMLAFIGTDAPVTQGVLKEILHKAVAASFHRITVDGDTSTNDACVLMATGRAEMEMVDDPDSEAGKAITAAVAEVCLTLAQAMVRDGEGATKFITILVSGGASEQDCLAVAYTVAHSPLVKTAFFASDANWGRILAAVGRAPVAGLDASKVGLALNGVPIVEQGQVASGYSESQGQAAMAEAEIEVHIDLGMGAARATVWTTDLSHEYVRINAEYRT